MFTNNKFAKMDSIANLINTILETDTKAKMEELKGAQHKIDKNKNNKIDAHDFAILRGEKKAMKKEESEQVDEMSHQAKTTMKHVKNPTAGEKTAAKDIKPGVAGYRDRIAMLHSAGAEGRLKKEEAESVDEMSHQAKTTMKHVKNPTAGEKTAAKDIKPGVAGYRDRIAMLHSAGAEGRLKKEEAESVDEAKEPGFRSSYGIGRKGTVAKKPETYGKRVQGKGYDKPENERKGPEGNVAMTSLMPGHDERAAKFLARQAKGTLVKGKAQSAKQMEKEEIDPKKTMTDTLKGREKDSSNPFLSKKVMMDVPGNVNEEQIDERTLTAPETAEKEKLVKGMKPYISKFTKRYGAEKGKSVMYGRATNLAKKNK